MGTSTILSNNTDVGTAYGSHKKYTVNFQADSSSYIFSVHNVRHVYLDLLTIPSYFTYKIDGAYKNKDDRARELAKNLVNEFLLRQYNINDIQNELTPLITSPHSTPNNSDFNCYNSNENVR
ncbi:unnamed protein product [Rotaria sp. Silwood2]|nr:unnamed protein product [Rotaria sp. Silwood2]CAF3149142.1 unnamed protein product [Rotaria sp. Silwood2]CAF3449639.1 unnamed protein product [Rotaria sp. Silwood2]CAF4484110.1 unnamed protein product [Rotaria sp. Silwood2]CAF4571479.1 unnamed protein product [Rotaria sp. Silwood2]